MSLVQFIQIFKARFWLFFFMLIVTVATTVVVSMLIPKTYEATTTLVIDFKGNDPFGGSALPIQMSSSYMATQIDVLSSTRVALKVVEQLNLADNVTAKQQFQEATKGKGNITVWLAEALLKNLDVVPSRESRLVHVIFSSTDPRFAAAVANAFANAYIETNLELSLDPAKRSTAWFDIKIKQMRNQVSETQSKLTSYQQETGIVATDERLDTETARLVALSKELVVAETATFDAESRVKQTNRLMSEGADESQSISEVLSSPFIQTLKAEILRQQAKIDELSREVGKNHPHYKNANAEINSLRKKMTREIKTIADGTRNAARLAREREATIAKAMEEQKQKMLKLRLQRDELNVLSREVETARAVYEVALQRSNQMNLESQFNLTNVAVLTPATEPSDPAKPKVLLNIILSMFLGALLSLGMVLLFEMMNRKLRSEQDLEDIFGVPMLAAIERSKA